jgi:hypothetical protein
MEDYHQEDIDKVRDEWDKFQAKLQHEAGEAWVELDKRYQEQLLALEERYLPLLNRTDAQLKALDARLNSAEHFAERSVDAHGNKTFLTETTLGDMDELLENQQMVMQEYRDARNSLTEEIDELWKEHTRAVISSVMEASEEHVIAPTIPRKYDPQMDKWISLMNMCCSMLKEIEEEFAGWRSRMESAMEQFDEYYRTQTELVFDAASFEFPKRPSFFSEAEELLANPTEIDERYFSWICPSGSWERQHCATDYQNTAKDYKTRWLRLDAAIKKYDEHRASMTVNQSEIEEKYRRALEEDEFEGRPLASLRINFEDELSDALRWGCAELARLADGARIQMDAVSKDNEMLYRLKQQIDEEAPDKEHQEKDPDTEREEVAEAGQ